jgi:membrane associated rhomboid family serine protease
VTAGIESEAGTPVLQATLKPPPVFSPGVVASVVFGLLLLTAIWAAPPEGGSAQQWTLTVVVAALTVSPVLFALRLSKTSGRRSLTLFPDRLTLPLTASSSHMLSVPLKELTGLLLFQRGQRSFVLIGTGPIDFVYPLKAFERSDEAVQFVDGVKARLREALPHGERTVDGFETEGARAASALGRIPWFTLAAVGTSVVVGLWLVLRGITRDPLGPLLWGGLAKPMVADGDVYRLWAYTFVHPVQAVPGDLMDFAQLSLVLSAVGLFLVGPTLERLVGPWLAAASFFSGSLVAGLLVALTKEQAVVAGAAGGWFGLVGATAFLWAQARNRLPLGFRAVHRLGFWVGLVGLVWTVMPEVTLDLAIGGLLGGVLSIAPFAGRPLPADAPAAVRAFAIVLAGLHGFGLFSASAYADRANRHLPAVVEASVNPIRLNHFGWDVALEKAPEPERMELAERAVRRALGLLGESELSGAFEDTLATILFRQGQVAEAIELEREVLDRLDDPHTASQLGRFLLNGEARPTGTSTRALTLSAYRGEDGRIGIRSRLEEPAPDGTRLSAYGVLHSNERPVGVFRVEIDPTGKSQDRLLDTPESVEGNAPLEARAVWLWTGGTSDRVWPFADSVREYPNGRVDAGLPDRSKERPPSGGPSDSVLGNPDPTADSAAPADAGPG